MELAFQIEPATWRDIGALRHLEQVCFPLDAWPLFDLIGVLTLPNVIRLKAVVEGEMAGFIALDQPRSDHVAWIATVGVLPQYRRRGIAQALITACEQKRDGVEIRLSVRLSNQDAIRLYERLGYRQVTIWKAYYEGGEDALVMGKRSQGSLNPL